MKKTLVALVCLGLVAPVFAKSRGFSSPSRSFSSPSRFSAPAPKPQPPKSPPPAAPAVPAKQATPVPPPAQPTVTREREVVRESGGFFSTAAGVFGGFMLWNMLFGSKPAEAAPAEPAKSPEPAPTPSPKDDNCIKDMVTKVCVK